MNNEYSNWLGKFLFKRGRLLEPDGRELYRYRTTEKEYKELIGFLRDFIAAIVDTDNLAHLAESQHFCQLFVLYSAEWWRRRYDGTGFSWDPIIHNINGNPASWNQQQRSRCIETGFRLWKVQLRQHGGLRYIISVALQGGLPVKLLAEGRGAIGHVLNRVLSLASDSIATQQDIEVWVESLHNRLPISYRQPAIYLLLADIVITVLRLKEEANLVDSSMAIHQLNERIPDWRDRFPLPIEDEYAQSLIAQLLCEAVTLKASSPSLLFPLKRQLENHGNDWRLYSFLECPEIIETQKIAIFFNISSEDIPQRAELTLRAAEQRKSVRMRRLAGQEKYRLERIPMELQGNSAAAAHVLELSASDGRIWNTIASRGEELDDELPWIFSATEPNIFLRQGGGKVVEPTALIALPQGWSVHPDQGSDCEERAVLSHFSRGLWRIRGTVQVLNTSGNSYKISTNRAEAVEDSYAWQGTRLWYDFHSPSQAFLGRPRLIKILPDGRQKPVDRTPHFGDPGNNSVSASQGPVIARYPASGELRWRSRMVLLPENAWLAMDSQSAISGTLYLHNWGAVNGRILTPGVTMEVRKEANHTLALETTVAAGERSPEKLELELFWQHTTYPVRLALPFPAKGVRAFDCDGNEWKSGTKVTIQQLSGSRIIIYKGQKSPHVALLLETSLDHSTRTFPLQKLQNFLQIILRPQDYIEEIQHLLSSDDDLDAVVTLNIIVDGFEHYRLSVARYAAHLKQQENVVSMNDSMRAKLKAESKTIPPMKALNLVQVEDESCVLPEAEGEFGMWSFNPESQTPGPWLIYPDPASPLAVRPLLWPVDGEMQEESTIARAIGLSNFHERQKALGTVVDELASDFLHPGWIDIEQLAGKLSHLSLTSLDIWRVLARSARGMVTLVLRLGGLPFNHCSRFPQELPFTWEVVPFSAWKEGISSLGVQCNTLYGEASGETIMRIHLQDVCDKITADFPALQYMLGIAMADFVPEGHQVVLALRQGLAPQAKAMLFTDDDCHLQNLLRHHSEDEWPTGCEDVLRRARANEVFRSYLCTENLGFRDPVINLPLLLAVQCATGHAHEWLQNPARIRMLRACRSFDPDWFAEAFNLTIARCLADGLLDQ